VTRVKAIELLYRVTMTLQPYSYSYSHHVRISHQIWSGIDFGSTGSKVKVTLLKSVRLLCHRTLSALTRWNDHMQLTTCGDYYETSALYQSFTYLFTYSLIHTGPVKPNQNPLLRKAMEQPANPGLP